MYECGVQAGVSQLAGLFEADYIEQPQPGGPQYQRVLGPESRSVHTETVFSISSFSISCYCKMD